MSERPVREHDPEWFWLARVWAASWKTWALAALGLFYGLAVTVGGFWAAAFGVLLLIAVLALARQLRHESRRSPP